MDLSWAYGDSLPQEDKVRLLSEALDLGCNLFDKANICGKGAYEELLTDAVCTGAANSWSPAKPVSSPRFV